MLISRCCFSFLMLWFVFAFRNFLLTFPFLSCKRVTFEINHLGPVWLLSFANRDNLRFTIFPGLLLFLLAFLDCICFFGFWRFSTERIKLSPCPAEFTSSSLKSFVDNLNSFCSLSTGGRNSSIHSLVLFELSPAVDIPYILSNQ